MYKVNEIQNLCKQHAAIVLNLNLQLKLRFIID